MSIDALRCYREAQMLGQQRREEAIHKVRDGIACFESLDAALRDAEESIHRYTESDFTVAHFYEVVKSEILDMKIARLKRVALDGDVLIFRVMENGVCVDRVFVRDPSQPKSINCFVQIDSYRTFVETYETEA